MLLEMHWQLACLRPLLWLMTGIATELGPPGLLYPEVSLPTVRVIKRIFRLQMKTVRSRMLKRRESLNRGSIVIPLLPGFQNARYRAFLFSQWNLCQSCGVWRIIVKETPCKDCFSSFQFLSSPNFWLGALLELPPHQKRSKHLTTQTQPSCPQNQH